MINKRRKILRFALLIIWTVFIFYMSNQNGEVSTGQSNFFVDILRSAGIDISDSIKEIITLIIRKGAHFSEYLILYILFYRIIIMYVDVSKTKYLGVLFVFLYACTDELHQLFIPGRTAAFKDVIIDTSGGCVGFIILSIINKYHCR